MGFRTVCKTYTYIFNGPKYSQKDFENIVKNEYM